MTKQDYGAAPSANEDLVRLQDIWGYSDSWIDYTPTLVQSGAVTKTVGVARYIQIGKMVYGEVTLSATGAGTGSNEVRIGLPVAAASAAGPPVVGNGLIYDASANTAYYGQAVLDNVNYVTLISLTSTAAGRLGAASFTAALASSDQIYVQFAYEAASGFGGLAFPPAGGWQTYTPTLVQSGAVTKTVTHASYTQVGRLVVGQVLLDVTGSGTSANKVTISLPVAAATGASHIGTGSIYDNSAGAVYRALALLETSTTASLLSTTSTALTRLGVDTFTAALANLDQVEIFFAYEAATTGGIPAPMTWTDYTPTVTQSATITKTVNRARYIQSGKTVTYNFDLSLTSAGTASNALRVSLPVPPAAGLQTGISTFLDASTSTKYVMSFVTDNSNNTVYFLHDTSASQAFGQTPAITVASGDLLFGSITYEAA